MYIEAMNRALVFLTCSLLAIRILAQTAWEQQASCPGAPRWGVVCFDIDGIGYMISGRTGTTDLDEVWAYDPLTDSWSERASIPGVRRVACAFSITGRGYVVGGLYGSSSIRNDLWEYDPTSNSWTQRTSLPGAPRYGSTAFVHNGIAYVLGGGTGGGSGPFIPELWAYDPVTDEWSSRTPMPDQGRVGASSFTAGGMCYVFGGRQEDQSMSNELWAYDTSSDSWSLRAPLPGGGRHYARAYAVLDRGVILSGQDGSGSFADGWVYSPWSNSWLPIEDYPGDGGWSGAQFALNERVFAGLGQTNGTSFTDLWELKEIPIGLSETTRQNGIEVYPTVISPGGTLNVRHVVDLRQFSGIMLSDAQGRRVAVPLGSVGPNTIRLPDLAAGTYLLTVPNGPLSTSTFRILIVP